MNADARSAQSETSRQGDSRSIAIPVALAGIGLALLMVLSAIAALALLRSWWALVLAVGVFLAASAVVVGLIMTVIEEEPSTERAGPEAEHGRGAGGKRRTYSRATPGRQDISGRACPSPD
jgi:hypothetical protein